LHYLTSIFLTLLFFLTGGDFAVAKNPVSSASLGDLCALAVNSSSSRTISQIIPSQTQSFTVNDRLTTDTYDANGNTTSSLITDHGSLGTNASDVYSFDNKLIRRTTADGKTIDLTYNPDGHRLSKFITQNGLTQRLVHYLTDANNPTGYAQVIEEKDPLAASSQELKKVNLYGHDLISSEERGTGVSPVSSIYYAYDGLGSVRSITDTTGELQETYDYDAYGTLIGLAKRNPATGVLESSLLTDHSTLLTQSEFLYTGEQWDADLGMYFLRARYLNTNTGRFHTQDTYEGSNGEPLTLHKYLYANGNPASYTDPSGYVSLSEMGLVQSLQAGLGYMTTAYRAYAVYEKVQTAIDIINSVKAIAEIVGNPTSLLKYSALLAKEAVSDKKFKKIISPEGILDGIGVLTMNSPRIVSTLLTRPNFIKQIISKDVKGFTIDMPSPPFGLNVNLPLAPTGLKIKGEPVFLNFRPQGGRFFGFSVKNKSGIHQLFRMDYHEAHGTQDWEDQGYHFHVGGKGS
jgi:RHS repeat-associated protein